MQEENVIGKILADLTEQERADAIVYLAEPSVRPGQRLDFPRLTIEVVRPSRLAFIDAQPNHDWGHPCRYLLIDEETGQIQSHPAQFPPFHSTMPLRWRVVHTAPSSSSSVPLV